MTRRPFEPREPGRYDVYKPKAPRAGDDAPVTGAAALELARALQASTSSSSSRSSSSTASSPRDPRRPVGPGAPRERPHVASSTSTKNPTRRSRRRERRREFIVSLEARGALGCRPRDFKRRTQVRVRSIFENRTGRLARLQLQAFPRAMRPELERVARHPGNGRELAADLHEQWSRWVIAVATLLWCERRASKRNGCKHVMDGFTQGMICGLFRNRDGATYSRSRVFGTSYRAGSDECSPFVALERAGVVFWQAPRTWDANPRFVGPPHADGRRYAFAVYWLRTDPPPG